MSKYQKDNMDLVEAWGEPLPGVIAGQELFLVLFDPGLGLDLLNLEFLAGGLLLLKLLL